MTTPDQIKARRKALGLHLDRLAVLSGVGWSTLQRMEAGTSRTYRTNLRLVELALDLVERDGVPPLTPTEIETRALRASNQRKARQIRKDRATKPHKAPPAAKILETDIETEDEALRRLAEAPWPPRR
jgi:transcriptional regulator with XRE-family HTH domain